MTDETTPQASPPDRPFEDLTLAEALREGLRAPRQTLAALRDVTSPQARRRQRPTPRIPITRAAPADSDAAPSALGAYWQANQAVIIRFVFYTLGVLTLWLVNGMYVTRLPVDQKRLLFVPWENGLPITLIGVAFIVVAEFYFWRRRDQQRRHVDGTPPERAAAYAWTSVLDEGRIRPLPLIAAGALGGAAYTFSGGNTFTLPGVAAWIGSVTLALIAFAPRPLNPGRSLRRALDGLVRFAREERGALLAVILITVLGALLRFDRLDVTPPEMTSDHLEKILDAERVLAGEHDIFFRGNGGREPLQMYLIALYTQITGAPNDFMAAKVVAALEGVVTLPVMFVLGVTIIGPRDRRAGILLGLAIMLVMAFGYWHHAIGRVALRIILTPLITSVVLIFLIRAMRFNRRADWLWAGLALGAGLYMYQAVRMLPVVVIAGALLALLVYARGWTQRRLLLFNFSALVLIAFAVFVPLLRFSVEYPNDFWRRSSGRLFGDELVQETLDDGSLIERSSTLGERLAAFNANLPLLGTNLRNVLLMFNYRGDVIYLHNAPTFPAFSPWMGALFLAGLVLWIVRLIRKRDAADALVFVALFIMLLPSALSIANPGENPSHTRTSGAMPSAYLLAGYGLFMLARMFARITPKAWRPSLLFVVFVLNGASFYMTDSRLIFSDYHDHYVASWKPLSDGGKMLRGFAESDGAYGNAFMLAYPHWWDYRIVAVEGGLPPGYWRNGDLSLERVPEAIYLSYARPFGDPLRLDPTRDLLFLLSDEDSAGLEQLEAWFPEGRARRFETYVPLTYFMTYRVPAPGVDGLLRFFEATGYPTQ